MPETILTTIKTHQTKLAFLLGLLIFPAVFLVHDLTQTNVTEEVHVHSDVLVYINGEKLDFTADKYQSSAGNVLHDDFHFHDNEGNVIHRHAADLRLVDFFASLGFTLTQDCLTTDTEETFCTTDDSSLRVYVNGSVIDYVESYVPDDDDQILIYFGDNNNPAITTYLGEVTADACIYSGTCPEKGLPPPESCGLTCEI